MHNAVICSQLDMEEEFITDGVRLFASKGHLLSSIAVYMHESRTTMLGMYWARDRAVEVLLR